MLQCWSTVTFCLGWGCLAWQSDLGKVWNYCNYLKILKVYGVSAKEDRKKKCNEVLEGWIRRDRERKLTKQHGYQEEFIDITQRNNLIPASITLNLTGKKWVYTIYIHTHSEEKANWTQLVRKDSERSQEAFVVYHLQVSLKFRIFWEHSFKFMQSWIW